MRPSHLSRHVRPFVVALALAAAACGGGSSGAPAPGGASPKPDFALTDVNEGSLTFGTEVSPRGHLGRVSAWYFGHAT